MKKPSDNTLAGWPKLSLGGTGWFLTAVGTAAALLLLIFPSLTALSARFRLLTAVGLIGVCALSKVVEFCFKTLTHAVRKATAYDSLHRHTMHLHESLEKTRKIITNKAARRTVYEMIKVVIYAERIHILVAKKPGRALPLGTTFLVIDKATNSLMGSFKVTDVKRSEYMAIADGDVDAVWEGFVRQTGTTECSPPPNADVFIL